MPWTSLLIRLPGLPLLLAGPILRQVTKDQVTVWVALQRNATVTLKVFDNADPNNVLMTGTRTTTAIGKNLYITAVTARSLTQTPLVPNKIYCYDLTFMQLGPPSI